jgi:hypothetical protein
MLNENEQRPMINDSLFLFTRHERSRNRNISRTVRTASIS